MKSDIHLGRTLEEIVLGLDEEELVRFAKAKARTERTSAQIENLDLDEEKLAEDLLTTFQKWRRGSPKEAA